MARRCMKRRKRSRSPRRKSSSCSSLAAATASAPVAAAIGARLRRKWRKSPLPSKPVSEASDFLFVLKSGVMVSAVAFTRQGDQLVYVTKEGNRRTLSVSTIDSDATTQVNAARGVPLKLSI